MGLGRSVVMGSGLRVRGVECGDAGHGTGAGAESGVLVPLVYLIWMS
jgi:hypothetical protein